MPKLYTASKLEESAIKWAKSAYGIRWRKYVRETVSEREREMTRFYPCGQYKHFCARPFGFTARDVLSGIHWNILRMAACQCLRRNEHFPKIAKRMQTT